MKTHLLNPTTKAECLPGEDRGQRLSIVEKVMESLAPGVVEDYPNIVQLIEYYLLLNPEFSDPRLFREALRNELRQLNKNGYEIPVEDALIVIDGMQAVMEDGKFASLEELKQYADASREEFRHFVLDLPPHDSSDYWSLPSGSKNFSKKHCSRE